MESALYSGHIVHTRHLPKVHTFRYPFFMWYLDLDNVDHLQDLGIWFSSRRWAFNRYYRPDYLGGPDRSLADCVREKMKELSGSEVTGKLFGLLNLRSAGLYFSPVNFYYGFAEDGTATHLLAEVSNTPWNQRHYYCHRLDKNHRDIAHAKSFKVSPFNPAENQTYKWKISEPLETLEVNLGVHDERGHVFEAALRLNRQPFTSSSARKLLVRKPVTTLFIMAGIYWQAMKIFLKGIPYIPYEKEKA
jgi:DUF1365 family protein